MGAAALLGPSSAAAATTFTVDNTSDTNTAGACDPSIADDCSLRQAIDDANSNAGADVVSFSGLSGNLITLTNGQINVTGDVDIQGPGADALTISGDADSDGVHDLAYYGYITSPGDSRIFQFGTGGTTPAGVTASVSGLTLSGGTSGVYSKYSSIPVPHTKYYGNSGGAIATIDSSLTVSHVTMTDNQATQSGGAVDASIAGSTPSNNLTITDSDLHGNVAYANGGGVFSQTGQLIVSDSQISGNATQGLGATEGGTTFKYQPEGAGGGIDAPNVAGATITGSTIANNTASDDADAATKSARGGGLYLTANSSTPVFQISGTTISGNSAIGSGGGAYIEGPHAVVSGSTIADNTVVDGAGGSTGTGGGIAARANLQLTASTLSGNHAMASPGDLGRGGGLYWGIQAPGQGLTVDSSTISGNQSSGTGGGAELNTYESYTAGSPGTTSYSGPVAFTNSTVSSNSASAGGGIYDRASITTGHPPPPVSALSSTIVGANAPDDLAVNSYSAGFDAGNSLIQSDVSGIPFTQTPAGSDVLGADPQLGTLKDNGGPTHTQLPAAGSPAVDAGQANSHTTDQRGTGFPRTADQPGVPNQGGSDGTDIGAVELSASAPAPQPGPAAPNTPAPKKKKCKKKKHKSKKSAQVAKKHCKKHKRKK